jgi:peptide/nickel transport system substrate-binding protein
MRARLWLSVVMLLAGVGLAAAAGFAGPEPTNGGTLRLGLFRDVDSLDPAIAYGLESWMIEFATCAKLYNYPDRPSPAGTIVIPEVATSLPKVSKDGKTQTIQLKRTYRFHTGRRITAASFVAAFNRDANPKLESPATAYLHEIVGADAVVNGKAQSISGVRTVGRYTLQIRTTRLVPDLASRLTMPLFCPIATKTPLQEIDDPLGSGPYYVTSYIANRQILLERNRFYRGPRSANVDQVVATASLGPEACRQAVEGGEQDYCEFLSPSAIKEVAAKYGINRGRVFFNPTLGTNYFAFNHDRPAFKGRGQIPLKKAINWAIDRRALVATRGYLAAKRTDQILPPGMGRNASVYPLGTFTEKSLARARALLAKARFKPTRLVLYTSNSAFGSSVAQIFQFNLKRLGMDVEIKYFSLARLFEKMGTRGEPFDVGFGSFAVDYADPISFFSTLDGDNIGRVGNSNIAYYDRPRYNRAIERTERLSGAARRRSWADLDIEMMRDDPPWAPYLNFTQLEFVSKNLGCYVFQPVIGRLDIAAACKK